MFENNKKIYSKKKNIEDNLRCTEYIQADDAEIVKLSNELTLSCNNDYDKVLKIHDWVAENIYYDFEAFCSGNYKNADAKNVLLSRRAVCEGYANLFAALVRAQSITCRVQSGYVLGIGEEKEWSKKTIDTQETNHAWNEIYIDNRWLIVDVTWNSKNKIENVQMIKGDEINHIYFDSNLEFFSLSHKLIDDVTE